MTNEQLQLWLRDKLSEETGSESNHIDLDTPFSAYKLDSLTMVSMSFDLGQHTGLAVDPVVFFEFDTPNKLVQWVQSQMK
jgi:acyl carrier protein